MSLWFIMKHKVFGSIVFWIYQYDKMKKKRQILFRDLTLAKDIFLMCNIKLFKFELY